MQNTGHRKIGYIKKYSKYEAFSDNQSNTLRACPAFIGADCFDLFFYAKTQIDVFDRAGDILISNTLYLDHGEPYNILLDPQLELFDLSARFEEVKSGKMIEFPAIEYFINATQSLWLEIKLMPVSDTNDSAIVCISQDVSKYKNKEFELLRNMADKTTHHKPGQQLISDHVAFLKYFIKLLPHDVAVFNSEKKLICSNYELKQGVMEESYISSIAPKVSTFKPFTYLGHKFYVQFKDSMPDRLNLHKDVLCVTDIDGMILDISDSAEKYLDEPKSKLIGNNIQNYYKFPKERETIIKKIKQDKSISDYTLTLKNSKGRVFRHLTNIKLIEDFSKPVLVSSLREIDSTSSKLEKVCRSEELLTETQKFSKTGSWTYDLLDGELDFSQQLAVIFDLEPDAIAMRNLIRPIACKDKIRTLRFFANLKSADKQISLECMILTKLGNKKIIYSEGKLEKDYYGNPRRIVGFTQDITKLREFEAEKQTAQNDMTSLYRAIPAMLIQTDELCNIVNASMYCLDKLGYNLNEIKDQPLYELLLKEGKVIDICTLKNATQIDADIIKKDNTLLHVRVNISPIFDRENITGLTVVLSDISDKVQINRELEIKTQDLTNRVEMKAEKLKEMVETLQAENERNKKLQSQLVKAQLEISKTLATEQESSELKSRFIDMISHEYRTPLTVIMSSAYIIERLADINNDQKIPKHIDKIIKASHAMTGLLDSTLDMVFQNRHDYQFMPSLFNLDNCLERVIKELEIIDGNSHKIEYINKIEEPTLYTDLRLTRLAVYNIIMNALKYSPKNSTVTIKAEENDGIVTISVRDEGDGIPESEQDMIFTPFYRGSQMGGLVPGTGLGLTVSKSCIEKLNGTITFDTEHGKGSSFYCTFPKRFVLRSK